MNWVNLNKLKQVELALFKQFVQIYDRLHLQYFLFKGTLLDVVRYKVCIPLDDDIDVAMLRKDYDMFLQQTQALLSELCFFQIHKTNSAWKKDIQAAI